MSALPLASQAQIQPESLCLALETVTDPHMQRAAEAPMIPPFLWKLVPLQPTSPAQAYPVHPAQKLSVSPFVSLPATLFSRGTPSAWNVVPA